MYLIGNGCLLTHDKDMPFIKSGAVAVEDDRIFDLGDYAELDERYRGVELIDAGGGIIMPGFINAHAHALNSAAECAVLQSRSCRNWFELMSKRREYAGQAGLQECIQSANAFLLASIKSGVTSIIDTTRYCSDPRGMLISLAAAASFLGIRICAGFGSEGESGSEYLSACINENLEFRRYCDKYGESSARSVIGIGADITPDDSAVFECISRSGGKSRYIINVCESADDISSSRIKTGNTPVERLEKLNALSDRVLLSHCSALTDKDIEIIAGSGAYAVCTPYADRLCGTGPTPIKKLLEAGIPVGLGADGLPADIISAARAAAEIIRGGSSEPYCGYDEAYRMLTESNKLIASRLFGEQLGEIKKGFKADIIIAERAAMPFLSEKTAAKHLLCGLEAPVINTSIINGKVVMRDRKILALTRRYTYDRIEASAEGLWKRLGVEL